MVASITGRMWVFTPAGVQYYNADVRQAAHSRYDFLVTDIQLSVPATEATVCGRRFVTGLCQLNFTGQKWIYLGWYAQRAEQV